MTRIARATFIWVGILFSQVSWADILTCLGKEESALHRSGKTGALYHLNQFLINKMSSGARPVLLGQYQGKICGKRGVSPSVILLRHLLLERNQVFIGSLESIPSRDEALNAFFDFLLRIQAMASDHRCLEKNLPHYAHFIHRHKYLEEEGLTLLRERDKLAEMFPLLERPDTLLAKCFKDR